MEYQVFVFNLVFLVIWQCIVKGTSGLIIYQSPSVTGREGGTVILNCTLSEENLGLVRWYKGENQQQQLLYSHLTTDKSDPRVSKIVNDGPTRNTDLSITFTNITWDDAGMYYCVKFKSDKVTVAASGNGTQLYVTRKPSPPSISGSKQQVRLNSYVTLSCLSAGFHPKEIGITWWQNEMKFQNDKITVSSYDGGKTYEVQSNITVQAKINSSVTCRINHTELQQPITSTIQITDIVNLMPSTPEISYHKKENGNATLTCTSSGFCPGNASVVWIIYGNQIKELQRNIISKTEDGTYNVTNTINVKVKDSISGVICEITHLAVMVQSPEFYLKEDSGELAIIILRCILGAVHLGVMVFLCYREMEKNRTGWNQ